MVKSNSSKRTRDTESKLKGRPSKKKKKVTAISPYSASTTRKASVSKTTKNIKKQTPQSKQKQQPKKNTSGKKAQTKSSLKTPPPNSKSRTDTTKGPKLKCTSSIFRDHLTGRVYYESCDNLKMPFSDYLIKRPPVNEDGFYPIKTFSVHVGDTVAVQVDSNMTGSPPKKCRGPGPKKNQMWYPFNVPWTTCQILAIYQNHSPKSKKEEEPYYFIAQFFNRKTEIKVSEIPMHEVSNTKNDNNRVIPNACKNMEEVFETDIIDVESSFESILAMAKIVTPDNDEKTETKTTAISKGRNENELFVEQFCQMYISLNDEENGRLRYHISKRDGICLYFDDQFTKIIQQFIEKHEDVIDIIKLRRFARGIYCFYLYCSRQDKKLKDGFITSHLNIVHQRMIHGDGDDNHYGNSNDGDNGSDDEVGDDQSNTQSNQDVDDDVESISARKCMNNESMNFASPGSPSAAHSTQSCVASSPSSTSSSSTTMQAETSSLPFHVDVSALKAFYSSIDIEIPWDNYSMKFKKGKHEILDDVSDQKWTVSVGDTVAIHVEDNTRKSYTKYHYINHSQKYYPLDVPWWTAEIVSIYLRLDNIDGARRLRETSSNIDKNQHTSSKRSITCGAFVLEVRWFYRQCDIPGTIRSKKKEATTEIGIEEIFETDEIGEIETTSLLGKVQLFSHPNHEEHHIIDPSTGMPIINLLCHQLWSVYRKTLLPIGSSENRIQRGMMYSKYMRPDGAARAALSTSSSIDGNIRHLNWQQHFQDTISKLSLAEASAAGGGNESNNIIGREKEQHQIKSFLQNAITTIDSDKEVDVQKSNLFVLFVGGAPGTGKTVSVRSIVYRLKQDQAKGNISAFDFVSVNGMEMRHPFDLYARLWEAVSPHKQSCPPNEALARLELFFGGNAKAKKQGSKSRKRRIIVLMVDEIDYIVTKKETVLYNLFDWPKRGYSSHSEAQLIVIGISNTLNLPERLHPRLQSRIGKDRCIYGAYGVDDSIQIINGKLGSSSSSNPGNIFHPDAIKFAARKISSESGDIRKVFHMCKAAAENVLNDLESGKRNLPRNQAHLGIIGIHDVQKASQAMFHSMYRLSVSNASDFEVLLFISLASLKRVSGRGGFNVKEVLTKMDSVASSFGDERYLPAPNCAELLRMLNRLGESRIIGLNGGYGYACTNTTITFQMEDYEIVSALKGTCHEALSAKFIPSLLF